MPRTSRRRNPRNAPEPAVGNTPTGDFSLGPEALSAQLLPIMRRRMASLQRRIANQARADVPVATGNLGRTIVEDEIKMVGPFRVDGGVSAGGPQAPYAAAVHEGSRPHLIRPRNRQFLRFEIGDRVVFTKLAHHPGTKSRPFLLNAAQRIAGQEH